MSRLNQAALALILSFFGLFLLWDIPDYVGAVSATTVIMASVFLYYLSQRTT
jgi:hypothetical protein